MAGRVRQDRRGDRRAGAPAHPAGTARASALRERSGCIEPAGSRRGDRRRARLHAGAGAHAQAEPGDGGGVGGRVRERLGAASLALAARGRWMKALVTGASRGIGSAVAEALIAEGRQVAVCALRAAPEVPGAAFAKRCDISDEVEVRALFAEAGRCDCVVLNAGVLERAPIEDFTAAQWDRVLGVNLRGAFLCAREAFRTGATRIVGIGSVSGTLGTAQAAVQARDATDVQKVLAFSRARKIPVVPRGAGSGKSGGALAERGGIVLSLEKLDRIVEVSRADMVCVVEPGVILEKLQAAVEAEGLFYPPDPNSQAMCSIGGNLAHNAGGPRALKYGVTRDYVLGLQAVLPTGELIRTGHRSWKGVAGYDLTQLLVGSEGTLAVIVQATLKVIPLPRSVATLLGFFTDEDAAALAVQKIFGAGLLPRACELLDGPAMRAVSPRAPFKFPEA